MLTRIKWSRGNAATDRREKDWGAFLSADRGLL